MQITVIGTGYVGLVTGACFAKGGNKVTCIDIDRYKIALLKDGKIPFYEPGLEDLVIQGIKTHHLSFTDSYQEGLANAEVCFLALPTPSTEDHSCDLTYVFSAVEQLARIMDHYLVIVNKSTVPVGTIEKIEEIIENVFASRGVNIPFDLVSNPEFLREGTAIYDCLNPDRIIVGVDSEKAKHIMQKIYAPFSQGIDSVFLFMNKASAELSKYAANAMLASRISFMNELSLICEHLNLKADIDIHDVQRAIGADKRIGPQYLHSGLGFGGSCLPKDVKALTAMANGYNCPVPMLQSILSINEKQRQAFFLKILNYFGNLSGKNIALWGLSFKPDTDDMREAPSLFIMNQMLAKGAHLRLYDPVAMSKTKMLFRDMDQVTFCEDEYHAARGADAIVLITEWKQFRSVNFDSIGKIMQEKVFFDGRNQYDPKEMHQKGFKYFCIGRKTHMKEYEQELAGVGIA